ncbi:swr complex subunit [Nowakowskiella sp. JEL0407]|nr:swr complex subunit [Nowakowskiella sp. JEL0407]
MFAMLTYYHQYIYYLYRKLVSFTNEARSDDLKLTHWQRIDKKKQLSQDDSTASSDQYPFSKFDKKILIVFYNDEEYNALLQDANWTREETDYLMSLCLEFDLRWIVITDRYEYPNMTRTMEDLKDRYFQINRKLSSSRTSNPTLTSQYKFDKDRETERKRHLELLFTRTVEQIREEEALVYELRRRERHEAHWAKEREAMVKIFSLNGDFRGPADNDAAADGKFKKKKTGKEEEGYVEEPVRKERLTAGVYLRGARLATHRPGSKAVVQTRVAGLLDEIGVGQKPLLPTQKVGQRFDDLKNQIWQLLEIKRQIDKLQHDLSVLQNKRDDKKRKR